jgi:hypothetical protein
MVEAERTAVRVVAQERVAVIMASQMTWTGTTHQPAFLLLMIPTSTPVPSRTTKQLSLHSTLMTHFFVLL